MKEKEPFFDPEFEPVEPAPPKKQITLTIPSLTYQKKRLLLFLLLISGIICFLAGVSDQLSGVSFSSWFAGKSWLGTILLIIGILIVIWTGYALLNKKAEPHMTGTGGGAVRGGMKLVSWVTVFATLILLGGLVWSFAQKMLRDDMKDRPEKYAGYGPANSPKPTPTPKPTLVPPTPPPVASSNDTQWTGDVDSRSGWIPTGLRVAEGDVVRLDNASGSIRWATAYWITEPVVDYTGTSEPVSVVMKPRPDAPAKFLYPKGNPGQLVFKVGKSVFALSVGTGYNPPSGGVLMVGINDTFDGFSDNEGKFNVSITVVKE